MRCVVTSTVWVALLQVNRQHRIFGLSRAVNT
jgi:hypothetical protein